MSQSKVRVLLVEADGVDSSLIVEALRSFGVVQNTPTPPIPPAIEIPAPADSGRALAPPAVEPAAEPEAKPQRQARTKRAARKTAASASPAPAASREDSGCAQACLAALAKAPRTSMELVAITKFTAGSVYPVLKKLREGGRVEMWDDPGDGQRKNRLRG